MTKAPRRDKDGRANDPEGDFVEIPAERSTEPARAPAPQVAPKPAPERQITLREFVAGRQKDPIAAAFASCEQRAHGVRKLGPSEWENRFKEFVSAERR